MNVCLMGSDCLICIASSLEPLFEIIATFLIWILSLAFSLLDYEFISLACETEVLLVWSVAIKCKLAIFILDNLWWYHPWILRYHIGFPFTYLLTMTTIITLVIEVFFFESTLTCFVAKLNRFFLLGCYTHVWMVLFYEASLNPSILQIGTLSILGRYLVTATVFEFDVFYFGDDLERITFWICLWGWSHCRSKTFLEFTVLNYARYHNIFITWYFSPWKDLLSWSMFTSTPYAKWFAFLTSTCQSITDIIYRPINTLHHNAVFPQI